MTRSYWRVFIATVISKQLPSDVKRKLVKHLLKDLMIAPIRSLLWFIDEVFYLKHLNYSMESPVFVISQPRCGSTFLHRTLAEDRDTFFGITYFEWRWPYVCLWRVIDRLGLREKINAKSYWPNTYSGDLAAKMHPHYYGSYEEHGVFLEEHFYHHYFVFRRFPLSEVLALTSEFSNLSDTMQFKIADRLHDVVAKVHRYRGMGKVWVTKENESVSFYRYLLNIWPNARCVFLVRDWKPMMSSYMGLSKTSTICKTGWDRSESEEWRNINITFRSQECTAFYQLYLDMTNREQSLLINYDELTSNTLLTIDDVYRFCGYEMPLDRIWEVAGIDNAQHERNLKKGYTVEPIGDEFKYLFEPYLYLVHLSKRRNDDVHKTTST